MEQRTYQEEKQPYSGRKQKRVEDQQSMYDEDEDLAIDPFRPVYMEKVQFPSKPGAKCLLSHEESGCVLIPALDTKRKSAKKNKIAASPTESSEKVSEKPETLCTDRGTAHQAFEKKKFL